jgi:hypothetical protein
MKNNCVKLSKREVTTSSARYNQFSSKMVQASSWTSNHWLMRTLNLNSRRVSCPMPITHRAKTYLNWRISKTHIIQSNNPRSSILIMHWLTRALLWCTLGLTCHRNVIFWKKISIWAVLVSLKSMGMWRALRANYDTTPLLRRKRKSSHKTMSQSITSLWTSSLRITLLIKLFWSRTTRRGTLKWANRGQ